MKKIAAILSLCLLVISCAESKSENKEEEKKPPKTIQQKELNESELVAFLDSSMQVIQKATSKTTKDNKLSKQFVTNATVLANKYPENSKSPFYLEVSAQMVWNDQDPAKALKMYNLLFNKFPEYEGIEKVLYHRAVILDLDLRKKERAVEAYQLLIERFPESVYKDDALNRIENIDKSIDEIVESQSKKSV